MTWKEIIEQYNEDRKKNIFQYIPLYEWLDKNYNVPEKKSKTLLEILDLSNSDNIIEKMFIDDK